MNIISHLKWNASKFREEEAIAIRKSLEERRTLSWKEFYMYSGKIANLIMEKGVKKGDKVGIVMDNSLFWLPVFFGILRTGAIAVSVNCNDALEEIVHEIDLTECKCIFCNIMDKCIELKSKYNQTKFDVIDADDDFIRNILDNYSVELDDLEFSEKDIAAIYFSSGTTGRKKAVLISHGALESAADTELAHHNQKHGEKFLCLTPLYHTGALIHWFGNLLTGSGVVIYKPISPMRILEVISRERIAIVWILLPQMQDILEMLEENEKNINSLDLSCLRLVHSGAQPIPKSVIRKWCKKFPWVEYDTNYGLTESTGPGCIHLGVENKRKAGAIGKPDPNWKVDIVNDKGESLSENMIGELILNGPGIMEGYYKRKVETEKTIKNGWLYTGDMAYKDAEGFIYLADRKKDIIISGGENIYPVQIENYLREFPGIKDVVVIGIPNERMGEIVAAVVEKNEGNSISLRAIYQYCNDLPAYQRPVRIFFDTIIRNSTGKIDRKKMREEVKKYWGKINENGNRDF